MGDVALDDNAEPDGGYGVIWLNYLSFLIPPVALSRISQEDKENILYKNAQKLFLRAF